MKEKLRKIFILLRTLDLPRAVNLLLFAWHRIIMPAYSWSQPISVDIEPTISCNLKCAFCHNQKLAREQKNMPLAEFRKILDNFPLALRVNIQGMGEPLLNPDLPEMIAYAKAQRKFVTITTNGMLLTPEMSRRLIVAGLDRLIISLDSADPETYARLRPGARLEIVLDNIRKFLAARAGKRRPQATIWMLALKENAGGLEAMARLAKDLGVDHLTLQKRLTSWGKSEWDPTIRDLEDLDRDVEINAVWNDPELKSIFSANDRYTQFKKDPAAECAWAWGGAYVSSDGRSVPCCLIADPDVLSMGDLKQTDFKTIWNDEKYRAFRKSIRSGKVPEACRQCYARDRS